LEEVAIFFPMNKKNEIKILLADDNEVLRKELSSAQ
jgi:hypothetical protein